VHSQQGKGFKMRGDATRREMPIQHSISWKPFHDSHYVVASLQPADGGRRPIFVHQEVLARVERLVRGHARHAVGLLLGQFYECSTTGVEYVVVESVSEERAVADEAAIVERMEEAVDERAKRHFHLLASARGQVLGWYRGAAAIDAKPSLSTAAAHVSLFREPWQMTLVVSESASSPGGAFFLHDTVNSRWFYAPFHELLADPPATGAPKVTFVNWPQYLTSEAIVHADRKVADVTQLESVRQMKAYERPWLVRKPSRKKTIQPGNVDDVERVLFDSPQTTADEQLGPPEPAPEPASEPEPKAAGDAAFTVDRPVPLDDRHAPLADRVAPQRSFRGFSDARKPNREQGPSRRAGRLAEKLSVVDDRDQRRETPSSERRISDDEDTSIGDDVGRYIEMARAEGFFIASKFEVSDAPGSAETLWVLNEPYSGMLLAVAARDSQVVDATLHYNLRTDDAGLTKTPFPEHRDVESKTIYVRETCLDSLRARCRRLRATNALLREWKVTPPISFLTPGEWESIPVSGDLADRGVSIIGRLNDARIAQLPAGVRNQFHLSGGAEASA